MGGVGFLLIVIYLVFFRDKKSSGVKSDQVANNSGSVVAVWLAAFTATALVVDQSEKAGIAVLVLSSLFVFPSFFSRLTAFFGWVKLSYFFGGISLVYFHRSPFSGSLMRGLQASYHLKSDEKKHQALNWLKARYLRRKAKIYSGEMVLVVIIDALLLKPHETKYMAQQLKLLEGIGQESIPSCVSVFASKLALAPALAEGEWDELRILANQWNTPATNSIVKYLAIIDEIYFQGSSFSLRIAFWYRRLFILKYRLLLRLPDRLMNYTENKNKDTNVRLSVAALWNVRILSEDNVQAYRKQLLSSNQRSQWTQRASELGVWKVDEAMESIEKSVEQCLAQKSHSTVELDDKHYEHLERLYKNMHYICESVSRRVDAKELGNGVQNYMDWFKIRKLLQELVVDENTYASAFNANHAVIWNWVADLWNNQKEYCLVHYIATVCAPIAKEFGHDEFYETLYGITTGKFK